VTSVCSLMSFITGTLSMTASWNLSRITRGSATPVHSTTMWSYVDTPFSSRLASISRWMLTKSSSLAEQQTQPFWSSSMSVLPTA
jgi:hypothetical protein